ncbi:MAG: right-handed parallel beta-helix repeat-containing protein, partial [Gemmatimonadota bacterium]
VNYSCIQGWAGFPGGTGNHGLDPLFADADGPDDLFGTEDDDLSLLEGSPCIDAGDSTTVSGSIATDLAGDPRILGDAVDLGAYEHRSPGIPALPTRPPRVMYVDDDATIGGTDGSSWENAYGCLHDALRIAVEGDEIRVAQGVYKPDRRADIELGDREATFQLVDGVALIGGYAGLAAPDPNARDHQLYTSVLSGDLAANDVGMDNSWHSLSSSFGENSFHVITCGSADESTVLDGFTVTGGNSREHSALYGSIYNRGGGMYIGRGSPRIVACTFRGNCGDDGTALAMNGGSPTLVDCTFVDNVSWSRGGGIFSSNASPILSRCSFRGNKAVSQGARGGAIYAENGWPVVANCIFVGNLAYRGGGLFNASGCSARLTNCLFNANSGSKGGGLYISGGEPIIVNSTFSGNKAEWGSYEGFGGGIYSEDNVNATLINCILWGNTDSGGSDEPAQIVGGSPTLNHCVVQAWTGVLSGTATHGADPLFVDADGADDVVGTEDDNLRLLGGSPCLDAGDQTVLPPGIGTDLDGSPRTVNGAVDLGAYEGPHQGFLLSSKSVEIPEGDEAAFTIALAMDPEDEIVVTVAIESGDPDITIQSPQPLTFDPSNYWRPQSVVVTAAEDADYLPGSAVIAITAVGFATSRLSATEDDTDELGVVYVDARARGVNDGTCWEDAFVDLQDALQVARENPTVEEVRVAQGVYCPAGPGEGSRGELRFDRDATFQLVNGVAIRGGYAGWREPEPDARDIQLYVTTLSGDLNHNDGLILDPCDLLRDPNRTDNSMHVVTSDRTDPTTVLDGFTIADGNASGARGREGGGGVSCFEGSPTILNCTFVRNSARINGAAVRSVSGSPTLLNCVFRDNASFSEGGGVYTASGSPILVGCVFVHNSVFGLLAEGGGMYSESDTMLINCAFNGNTAEVGGGMYSSGSTLFNCVFTGNTAVSGGGIGVVVGADDFVLKNCTFVGNSAQHGSAMAYGHPAHPLLPGWEEWPDPGWKPVKLVNSILWDGENQIYSAIGAGMFNSSYSNVQGGLAGEGNIDLDPAFVDADGADDLFGTEDDNPRLRSGSPCIDAGSNEADTEAEAVGASLLVGVDADLQVRRVDEPGTADTGLGRSSIVDMGAYEFGSSPVPSVLCVNDDAEGANTGASWNDALTDLQCALLTAFVAPEKVDQIWVAAGVYTPARPGGERSATFGLINGLGIYGGFAGGETSLDQRDPAANVSVLSGDLNRNDMGTPGRRAHSYPLNTNDNCYHVVVASYTNATSVLDGFTISGGNADLSDPLLSHAVNDRGAGVYVASGSPQIRNCVVTRNAARVGAGIWCERARPTFVDCVIANNSAGHRGGGSYCYEASPLLERCTIKANTADQGAGTYCDRSTPSFVGCMFNGNQAAYQGGGCLGVGGEIRLTDCTFNRNRVDAVSIVDALVDIEGVVQVASNDFMGDHTVLTGDGTLHITPDATLNLNDSTIRCDVSGPGLVLVGLGSELTVEGDALIDLGAENDPNGRILCHGLLRVKDEAVIANAWVNVTRA